MIGIAASTKADNRGLVTTIMMLAPTNNTRLRSATETEEPTLALICVVSAVSREIDLAGLGLVEKHGRQRGEMRKDVAAQIGDDALAERGDEEVARGAGEGEHGRDPDHDQKIAVDQREPARGEAEIDHPPYRDRHDQRRQRGQHQGAERGKSAAAVTIDVRQQRGERPQI